VELSNFTHLVLAAVELFRLCVFRSVSVRFIICFFSKKSMIRYDTIEEINVDSKAEYTA